MPFEFNQFLLNSSYLLFNMYRLSKLNSRLKITNLLMEAIKLHQILAFIIMSLFWKYCLSLIIWFVIKEQSGSKSLIAPKYA